MAETTPFTIGAGASCSDGVCGEVTRVVGAHCDHGGTEQVQDGNGKVDPQDRPPAR
jgi:hypothetical protein